MIIETKMHTIFLLVGPTECGKTTFSKDILMKQLTVTDSEKNFVSNVQYLSSDDIRQDLLGHSFDKYDRVMLEASNVAFPFLKEKLQAVTTYPISAEFVIVDTTGLAKEFREEISKLAREQNYRIETIVFDYKNREDYYQSERSRRLISDHIQRLKREVLPQLARENYHMIHRVTKNDFSDISVTITDQEDYYSCLLPANQEYDVIGDIHECVDTLKELLTTLETSASKNAAIDSTKTILVGDWIDKGNNTKKIIEFLYDNQDKFLFTIGNHENFVYKYLKETIKGTQKEVLETYFDSIPVLQQDQKLAEKFFHLVEQSKPFFRRIGTDKQSFIVTHAPCKAKYLGKLDTLSRKKQRNFRLNREADIQKQLAFLEEESYFNLPLHIFGHVANQEAFRLKNKRSIDTGAVSKNRLTAIRVLPYKTMLYSVSSNEGVKAPLPLLFAKPKRASWKLLSDDQKRKLRYMVKNKIQFVSGTMAPSAADVANNELESLAQGLLYFKQKGVKELILQPKYMGSRCNLYLFNDLDKCYAITRNGNRIQHLDLSAIYQRLLTKFSSYMQKHNIDMLLLDGELLPWSALGDGLIRKEYQPIAKGLEIESTFLKEHHFDQAFTKLNEDMVNTNYSYDIKHHSKKEMKKKYGEFKASQYKYLSEVAPYHVPVAEREPFVKTYEKQLELYGAEAELTYSPFDLLKIVYKNGSEELPNWSSIERYTFVSDDLFQVIDLQKPEALQLATQFFDSITVDQQMEGIVLKPNHLPENTVPFMKVRNKDYLTLIYGYDYQWEPRYKKLTANKKTTGKLKTSLKEYELAKELLAIPVHEINENNEIYLTILADLLFELSKEKELDPRL
ncbi:hypothetical protein A5881_000871 [Enterococcus termitis]|nr:hypothetical protein A5881_001082 [Enterococcus termitis]